MDPVSAEALDQFAETVRALLPAAIDPVLPSSVAIAPVVVESTGIGGFVAMNATPVGDIVGRRIRARVVVTANAKDNASLSTSIAGVSEAFLSDHDALRAAGLLNIRMVEFGTIQHPPVAAGESPVFQRDLSFDMTYEFLKAPSDNEDVISSIPIGIQLK